MAAHLFLVQRALRRERVIKDRYNPLEKWDDVELYSKFRMTSHGLRDLTDLLSANLEAPTLRNQPIPPILQVCTALRFYATGSFQSVCADISEISQPSVSRIITRVTESIVRVVFPRYVKFPSNREVINVQRQFYEISGFPGIAGVVDGTHVKILAPSEHEEVYVNRKMFHSINVQIICDARMFITNIVAKYPGSTHDARIWRESGIGEQFARGERRGIILGDSGYPCHPYLMTPIANPQNRDQERYNSALKHTRCIVENVIGVWKRRFHCLHDELRLAPEKACQVIAATAAIHNFAKARRMPDIFVDPPNQYQQPPAMAVPNEENAGNLNGRLARQRLVERFFHR